MTTANSHTVTQVVDVLVTTLGIEDRRDEFQAETLLLDSVPELDSMAVVEVVTQLEDRFDIHVDDEDITGEIFDTVGSLAAFVDAQRS